MPEGRGSGVQRVREVQVQQHPGVGDRDLEHREWAVGVDRRRPTAGKERRHLLLREQVAGHERRVEQEAVRVAARVDRLVVALEALAAE